ncbi:hypothetical protein OSTOST_19506 [Ostertagia ostertagi]
MYSQSRLDTIREYNFDGFHVVFLPFAEDVRDVSDKMKCPQGEWPKRIVLLGFKPISEINFENHIQPSRFLYPDESSVIGSACLYRALLERCWARKMAMICRFCSRANQKVRLVALIPQMSAKSECCVYRHRAVN